jgi:hypothetical protein
MTKRTIIFMLSVFLVLLAACNSTEEPNANEPTPFISPSLTPIATIDPSYPGPQAINTPLPDAYPLQPTPAPAQPDAAYPGTNGETMWIVRPLGQQCVDLSTYTYPDLSTAVAALTTAGITVLSSEEVALMVCEACDCPTSEHFRVLINSSDFAAAQTLGWMAEN